MTNSIRFAIIMLSNRDLTNFDYTNLEVLMSFIGRKSELEFLNDAYNSDKAEFIVLYGRRRVGKTELLNEFCKNKNAIFYTCREYTDTVQLKSFTEKVKTYNIPAFDFIDSFKHYRMMRNNQIYAQRNRFVDSRKTEI